MINFVQTFCIYLRFQVTPCCNNDKAEQLSEKTQSDHILLKCCACWLLIFFVFVLFLKLHSQCDLMPLVLWKREVISSHSGFIPKNICKSDEQK